METFGDAEAGGEEFFGQVLHANQEFLAACGVHGAGLDELVEAFDDAVWLAPPQTAGGILRIAAKEVEIVDAEGFVVEKDIAHVLLFYLEILDIFGHGEGARILCRQTEEAFGLDDHRLVEVFKEGIAMAVVGTLGAERTAHNEYQRTTRVALANKHLARLQTMESNAYQLGNLPEIAAANTLEERQLEKAREEVFTWNHLVCNFVLLVGEDACAEFFFNTNLTNLSNAMECAYLFPPRITRMLTKAAAFNAFG